MIPYGRQHIEDDDIEAVVGVLRSDWLTQGPKGKEFEEALAVYTGAKFVTVVSSGTAALQAAFIGAGIKQDDEFITSPMTFPATSNVGLWLGAKPVFVDIDPNTGNINPELITEKITNKTKAIVPIDYTGRPADLDKIKEIAAQHNLLVIEDAAQSLGGSYNGVKVGALSDFTTFSFHPVKSITTGEGGAVLTNSQDAHKKMQSFVRHGVVKEDFVNTSAGDFYFEMQELGQNFRLTDIQAALGITQLKKLDKFINKRKELAERYSQELADVPGLKTPEPDNEKVKSSWHLYVANLVGDYANKREEIFKAMRNAGVGVQVHHIPVHLHPYYQKLGYQQGLCPEAEKIYGSMLTLHLYPDLSTRDQDKVIEVVKELVE
jgi:perosamine synthetase